MGHFQLIRWGTILGLYIVCQVRYDMYQQYFFRYPIQIIDIYRHWKTALSITRQKPVRRKLSKTVKDMYNIAANYEILMFCKTYCWHLYEEFSVKAQFRLQFICYLSEMYWINFFNYLSFDWIIVSKQYQYIDTHL